jgi:hypothetical protein
MRASDRAVRKPTVYDRMRDELAANLESWMAEGGAILEDAKLSKELHALEWKQAANGRLKVTDKITLRKLIGRSPDRYDAAALAAWEPLSLRADAELSAAARAAASPMERAPRHEGAPLIDPYAGASIWQRR